MSTQHQVNQKNLSKRQFGVIWFMELWERYAFYGFQSLFLLFITAEHLDESKAYLIFGIFAALLYLTPTIGGYIADKYIGIKRALVVGGIMLFIGYGILALTHNLNNVMWALSFIIVGNGFFKPAPTALISKIFSNNAASSNSAFTLYYMGVNIGSFLGIAITPIIAEHTGYSAAFGISVLGMIVSLLNYALRYQLLKYVNGERDGEHINLKIITMIILGSLIQILICYCLFQITDVSFYLIMALCIVMFIYMLQDAMKVTDSKVRFMQIIGVLLIIEAVVYFVIYNQMFSTLVLFAKHNVHLTLIGLNVSPATYASLDSFWVVILSPILAILYQRSKRTKLSTMPYKYALGTIISGVAFIVLFIICLLSAKDGYINGNWMILFYVFAALAELLVAALGFSLVALYFRKEIVTLGMGFFMLALAAGGALAGKLGQLVAMPDGKVNPLESLPIYMSYFFWVGLICIGLGFIYVLFAYLMQRWAQKHQVELK